MSQPSRLEQYAKFLHNAAPVEFEEFAKEFASYSETLTVAVTTAPVGEVLVAQGRAQAAMAVLRCLRDCTLRKEIKPPVPQ